MDGEQIWMTLLLGDTNSSRVQRRVYEREDKLYIMIALGKWDIYIGKLVNWDNMW